MTCEEFLRILDERADTLPKGSAWTEHAASCPGCALALRIERALLSAPTWTEAQRLAPPRRAALLDMVRTTSMFWPRFAAMAEDSALSALSAAALATLLFVVVPEVWASSVPEDIRRTAAPYLQPFLEGAHTLAGPFRPLLNNGWGLALLGLAGFTVLFAAVLSARTLSPRST